MVEGVEEMFLMLMGVDSALEKDSTLTNHSHSQCPSSLVGMEDFQLSPTTSPKVASLSSLMHATLTTSNGWA